MGVLALLGCGDADGRHGTDDSAATNEPAPISFDPLALDGRAAACVEARTAIAPSAAPQPVVGEPVPLYYAVGVACRVVGGEDIQQRVRQSYIDDNPGLEYVSACLTRDHGWTDSANAYNGIGGAVAPEGAQSTAVATAVADCRFHDGAAIQ